MVALPFRSYLIFFAMSSQESGPSRSGGGSTPARRTNSSSTSNVVSPPTFTDGSIANLQKQKSNAEKEKESVVLTKRPGKKSSVWDIFKCVTLKETDEIPFDIDKLPVVLKKIQNANLNGSPLCVCTICFGNPEKRLMDCLKMMTNWQPANGHHHMKSEHRGQLALQSNTDDDQMSISAAISNVVPKYDNKGMLPISNY